MHLGKSFWENLISPFMGKTHSAWTIRIAGQASYQYLPLD